MCCSPIRELTPASRFAMHPRSAASQCDMDGNSDSVARFAKYYHRCAELKNLPRASTERMAILARHKALAVSFVQDTTGEILAAGTYLVTPRRVRNLQAVAAFRATSDPKRRRTIAYANRYLYWRDILRFQEAGAHIFDFGGWYSGNDDAERLRVNDFEEEFGKSYPASTVNARSRRRVSWRSTRSGAGPASSNVNGWRPLTPEQRIV